MSLRRFAMRLHSLGMLFESRKLFSNWLSARVKYSLIRRGLTEGDIKIKLRCGNKTYTLNQYIYYTFVSAYYNGEFRLICDGELVGRFWGAVDLIYRDGELLVKTPDGILLAFNSFHGSIFKETWVYDIHFLGFDLSDWIIIDIGAFVGDTALYYAKRGAFVVAVEPLPSNYEAMLRDLSLNPELRLRVMPINAAVSGEDGFVEFKYGVETGSASAYGSGGRVIKVRAVRLSTLLKDISDIGIDLSKFKVKVLKADCKGCEYELVDDEALKLFDIVKIEYSGFLRGLSYRELLNKLETLGFKCRVWGHHESVANVGLDKFGTLTCVKDYGYNYINI